MDHTIPNYLYKLRGIVTVTCINRKNNNNGINTLSCGLCSIDKTNGLYDITKWKDFGCDDKFRKGRNCIKPFDVTWTTYLINKQYLIEVKNE